MKKQIMYGALVILLISSSIGVLTVNTVARTPFDWGVCNSWGNLIFVLTSIMFSSAILVSIKLWWTVCLQSKRAYVPALPGLTLVGIMVWQALSSLWWQGSSIHHQASIHVPAVITVTIGFFVSLVVGIVGISELRSALAKTLRRNVQIIIGAIIGVCSMLLINQLETFDCRRYLGTPGGMTLRPESFVRGKSFGGFHLALWRDVDQLKHYLEVTTKSLSGPRMEISTIAIKDEEEIISNMRVLGTESILSFTDVDHDGDWDCCHYRSFIGSGTNYYIMLNDQKVAVDSLVDGMIK